MSFYPCPKRNNNTYGKNHLCYDYDHGHNNVLNGGPECNKVITPLHINSYCTLNAMGYLIFDNNIINDAIQYI